MIGNVAFMRADYEEGVKRHERAAKLLSPANDIELWARFNKASAAVRLSGGIVLKRETFATDAWLQRLGAALADQASSSRTTRQALERLLND